MSTQIDNYDPNIMFTMYCGPVRTPCVDVVFKDVSALKELRAAYSALWSSHVGRASPDDLRRWQSYIDALTHAIKD